MRRHINSLKRKRLQFDEIFITGTGSCQDENFQCSQWLTFRQNNDIFISMMLFVCYMHTVWFCLWYIFSHGIDHPHISWPLLNKTTPSHWYGVALL